MVGKQAEAMRSSLPNRAGSALPLPASATCLDVVQTRARVIVDETGAVAEIPILLTADGPLEALVDYLLWHRQDRSVVWMRKVVQAVSLLFAYMKANAACFDKPEEMFHSFADRLHSGTVGDNGNDPSGLYWRPMRRRTAAIPLGCLSDFSDWMVDRHDSRPLNPSRTANRFDETLAQAAREHKRSRAFLGHTWSRTPTGGLAGKKHYSQARRSPKLADDQEAVPFSERRFTDLLLHGFARRGGGGHSDPALRLNLRDCLITLLMHGAGFRLSECFHLWVHDVAPDPNDPTMAMVRIHHPSEGEAPDDWKDERDTIIRCNRATYLSGRHALRPRNELMDISRAGWKDPMLDGKYFMQAYWFPVDLGRLFLHLWRLYLCQIVQTHRHHPYAFIVQNGSSAGDVYSIAGYKQAHARAVQRIGLLPIRSEGGTPHAHRHAYGRRLMRAGIDPILRRKALHHKSLASQAVYTAPNAADVAKALNAAQAALDRHAVDGRIVKPEFDMARLLAFGFESIDPDGLLSGDNPKLMRTS
jgi:hypothetical protein